MRGEPLIYSGQEVGRTSKTPFFTHSPINWSQNADMLQAYQQLYSLYAKHAIAKSGADRVNSTANVLAWKRSGNAQDLLVVVNMRNAVQAFAVPKKLKGSTWKSAFSDSTMVLNKDLSLQHYQYRLMTR